MALGRRVSRLKGRLATKGGGQHLGLCSVEPQAPLCQGWAAQDALLLGRALSGSETPGPCTGY